MALVTFRHQSTQPFEAPRELKTPLLLCLLMIGISGLITAMAYSWIQFEVPLFYSLSQPEQQLAPRQWIFLFPIASAIMVILNRIFIHFLRKYDHQVTKIYTWMTVFLIFLLNFALIRILYVIS